MALFSKEQLKLERSRGLQLTDKENEGISYNNGTTYHWTNEQFEKWLEDKSWSEKSKQQNRDEFKGKITFNSDGSKYNYN